MLDISGQFVEDVGRTAGEIVGQTGDWFGLQGLHDAGATVTSATHDAGEAVKHAGDVSQQWGSTPARSSPASTRARKARST